jgi:hypothetical protein
MFYRTRRRTIETGRRLYGLDIFKVYDPKKEKRRRRKERKEMRGTQIYHDLKKEMREAFRISPKRKKQQGRLVKLWLGSGEKESDI